MYHLARSADWRVWIWLRWVFPIFKSYVASYCQRTGRSGIDNFEYYLAYNMFRMAGILQGIMKRVVDGTAASEQAVAMGKAARPLAELGWKVVEKLQQN